MCGGEGVECYNSKIVTLRKEVAHSLHTHTHTLSGGVWTTCTIGPGEGGQSDETTGKVIGLDYYQFANGSK